MRENNSGYIKTVIHNSFYELIDQFNLLQKKYVSKRYKNQKPFVDKFPSCMDFTSF